MKLINFFKNWFSWDRDYYNGSEYDIENVFIELKKEFSNLISNPKRINFLVDEGLFMINLQKERLKEQLFTNEEINQIIENAIKNLKK
jgi:hypothetical protein